ncbi:MAG: hypothetical protein Q7V57_17050 [Actinomycetota bacterium]|nr:hypothetical protein [Actinomycetota bacterium]
MNTTAFLRRSMAHPSGGRHTAGRAALGLACATLVVSVAACGSDAGLDVSPAGTGGQTEPQGDSTNDPSATTLVGGSYKEVYDCAFSGGDSPVVPAGYTARLFASPNVDVGVGEVRPEVAIPTFDLADFVVGTTEPPVTVFFSIAGDQGQFIPGVSMAIEVCNADTNKSTGFGTLADWYPGVTSDNTSEVEQHLTSVEAPDQPGQYRMDGLMRVNGGAWQLVATVTIEFT